MYLLNLLFLSISLSKVYSEDFSGSSFPLFGIVKGATKSLENVKSECNKNLIKVYHGINKRETWALKMLGSSGAPQIDHIWGNTYWLGSYSECRKKSDISNTQRNRGIPPDKTGFFMAVFQHNETTQTEVPIKDLLHIGLCLPSICTSEDLESVLSKWANDTSLTVLSWYKFKLEFLSVRQIQTNFSWFDSPIAIGFLLVITIGVLLTFSGTVYDVYVWTPLTLKKAEMKNNFKNNKNFDNVKIRNIQEHSELLQDNNLNESCEYKIDNSQHKSMPVYTVKPIQTTEPQETKQNLFGKLVLYFSAKRNIKIIMDQNKIDEELTIIKGLRFFGMMWLIWLYIKFYIHSYSYKGFSEQSSSEKLTEGLLNYSTYALDTFFFTSGFFLSYKYYKERRGGIKTKRHFSVKENVNKFFRMVLKRFFRLTPVYLMIIMTAVIFTKRARQTSLFEVKNPTDDICQKYWWRNLVYINNLFKENEMCVSWSWYLSTDMQFFLIGVFILILSARFGKLAALAALLLAVLSCVATGYLSYTNRYLPIDQSQAGSSLDFFPWTRIGPYIAGLITGYCVAYLKGELLVKKTTLLTTWLLGALSVSWALFGLRMSHTSLISIALHVALSRIAWAFGLSWVVVACSTNHADIVKTFLSLRVWSRFDKLFYSAFLISPIVINFIFLNGEAATHVDLIQMVVYFIGGTVITYCSALLLSILLEIPIKSIGDEVLGKQQTQNQLN